MLDINIDDRVRFTTTSGKVFQGVVDDFIFENHNVEHGKTIGFWWLDRVNGTEEAIMFEEIETLKVLEYTQFQKTLKSILLPRFFDELEAIADSHLTNIDNIIFAFVHDLICSEHSGGSDERDLASQWLSRNVFDGEFIR